MNRYFKIVEIETDEFVDATGEDLDCCQLVAPTSEGVFVAVNEDEEDYISVPLDCFERKGAEK